MEGGVRRNSQELRHRRFPISDGQRIGNGISGQRRGDRFGVRLRFKVARGVDDQRADGRLDATPPDERLGEGAQGDGEVNRARQRRGRYGGDERCGDERVQRGGGACGRERLRTRAREGSHGGAQREDEYETRADAEAEERDLSRGRDARGRKAEWRDFR